MAEEQLTAEEKGERESHAEEQDRAAGVHIVGVGVAAMQIRVGSRGFLVEADEAADANIAALRSLVEVGPAVVGSVGFVDIAAQKILAVVADIFDRGVVVGIVAQTERVTLADTAEWAENAEIVDTAVSGVVGCADAAVVGTVGCTGTADVADSVGLLHWSGLDNIVEVVDDTEAAVGTADTVAATEWQPSSTTMAQYLDSSASRT